MSNINKLEKTLGRDTIVEMQSLAPEALHKAIVDAEQAMKQVADELEANGKYQELKDQLSAVTQGKKDVNKRQKAKIAYALNLLNS